MKTWSLNNSSECFGMEMIRVLEIFNANYILRSR